MKEKYRSPLIVFCSLKLLGAQIYKILSQFLNLTAKKKKQKTGTWLQDLMQVTDMLVLSDNCQCQSLTSCVDRERSGPCGCDANMTTFCEPNCVSLILTFGS